MGGKGTMAMPKAFLHRMNPGGQRRTQYALQHGCALTGWSKIARADRIEDQEELRDEINRVYDTQRKAAGLQAHSFWLFLHDMGVGDYVVSPDGDVVHIGRIQGPAVHYEEHVGSDSAWRRMVGWGPVDYPRASLSEPLRKQFYNPNTTIALYRFTDELEQIWGSWRCP